MIRAFLFLVLVAGMAGWLNSEHRAGRFRRVDELFLDFLVANARERFTSVPAEPAAYGQVVLVKMNVAEKAEYAGWPPRPLDWQMVLKGLQPFEPAVLVIPETLAWGHPSPEFVREAAEALLPFPSTVLGVEGQLSSTPDAPAFLGGLGEVLPRFQKVNGDLGRVLPLGALVVAPDDLMRRQAELGIAMVRKEAAATSIPYALREGGSLLPGVLAQALARYTHTPYAAHRLVLGPGAGAYLEGGGFVPLSSSGEFDLLAATKIGEVNALDLMNDGLVGALGREQKALLGTGKIIVIGTDDSASGGGARLHAEALSRILAMPRLRLLPPMMQMAAWLAAGLAGAWLVFGVPRRLALWRGALLVFAALVVCFLAFQSSLIWCPPTIPAALIVLSALFARVAGKKHDVVSGSAEQSDARPAESSSDHS